MAQPVAPITRFWEKVEKSDGCWLWTGARNSSGYGVFWLPGDRWVTAHRWHYEQMNGPIASPLQLDHLCRTRACVRLDHLEVVSARENTLRGIGLTAQEARRTHCPRGHPYDLFNTYIWKGCRGCRACWPIVNAMRKDKRMLQEAGI